MELLGDKGINTPVARIGWPDQFIEHASRSKQLAEAGLDKTGIEKAIATRLHAINQPNTARVGAL